MSTAGANVTTRTGRPRSQQADAAIVDATLGLLAEAGFGALSIEAVAARAGVGKATIYRRWPSKNALMVDALACVSEVVEELEGRDLRADLVVLVDAVRRRAGDSLAGQILPRLIGEGVDNPELLRCYRARVIAPRRARVADVVRRGMASGELRGDLDVEEVVDLLVGPVVYRKIVRPDDQAGLDGLAERVLDLVLPGLRAEPADSGHGPASSG